MVELFDDGTATDNSGHGHNGTIHGAIATPGVSNTGMYFNGSAWIDFGSLSTNVYTFIVWVKPTNTITKDSATQGTANFSYEYGIGLHLGRSPNTNIANPTITLFRQIPDQRTCVIDLPISNTQYHMIAFVWNSSVNRYDIYFDGAAQPVTSGSYPHVQLFSSTDFDLGWSSNPNWLYKGIMDEVRIYDRALSEAEICQLYNLYGPWDQNKLYFDPVSQFPILHYTDADLDGCHDPGEPYFAGPGATNDSAIDMSCWMASASNIMQHECKGNYYLSWLRDGAAPSPKTDPWGVVRNACGGNGGDHMTFDDGGWQHWALGHAGCIFSGPITTTTEFGAWSTYPITWCRKRLASDHLIGITIWWGTPPPGALPGWIGHDKLDGYHAITLWDIDPVAGTLTITDSDDQLAGQRVLSYTFTYAEWVIQDWNPGQTAHINYAVSSRSEGDGDVNNDGVLNSADIVYLINFLFIGGPAPQPLAAGDVNCDGIITAADVVYLINYLFISGPPPGC